MIVRLFCLLLLLAFAPLSGAHAQTAAGGPGSAPRAILVMGDSLSAEYGLTRGTGWVARLEERLRRDHPQYRVVNASVSGETTSGGVNRLPPLLAEHRPAIVILELGGNDALRGLSLDMTERNLDAMAGMVRQARARLLVAGMQIPPNYGRAYTERFRGLFARTAQAHQAALVPFLLEGIAEDRANFQPDGIHPSEAAQPVLMENVWKALEPLLR